MGTFFDWILHGLGEAAPAVNQNSPATLARNKW